MAAIVVQPQQNELAQTLMALFAQTDARAAERQRLAQQQGQLDRSYGLEKQQADAQVAALNASAGASGAATNKTNYEVATDRAGKIVAPIMANIEAMSRNGVKPENIAAYATGEMSRLGDDPEVKARLVGYLQPRPDLPSDATAANLATIARDTTGRVAAGGQNAIDVNLATKLGVGEQLSGPAFANQNTREFGPDALRAAMAIEDDRAAGATPQLQSATAIQTGREQNASAERIAAMRNAAELEAARAATNAKLGGTTGGRGERNANLAADGVALIDDLLKHEGFSGAIGAKGPSSLFGVLENPLGGTDAAGYAAKLERLRSLTTLPNLEMMRGLGAMSEKEMELVRASAGALSRDISEKEFRVELERMKPVLEKASKALSFGASAGVPQAAPTFDTPDGKKWRKVAGGWEEVQ